MTGKKKCVWITANNNRALCILLKCIVGLQLMFWIARMLK